MANKVGNYKRKQWKKEGGQAFTPISGGGIGKKAESWLKKRKVGKNKQG